MKAVVISLTFPRKMLMVAVMTAMVACTSWSEVPRERHSAVNPATQAQTGCVDKTAVSAAIENLSHADPVKAREASQKVLGHTESSLACKSEIITLLIRAMDKPDLNFISDKATYSLWLHGSHILGKLKAEEALDLLITHLDLNDGLFRGSLQHQPALGGVMEMGVVAVPKLSVALQNHQSRDLRVAAALCLSHIGGPDAMRSLQSAHKSDPDECVRRFAGIALKLSKLTLKSNNNRSESEVESEIDLRGQLLVAYRCG